MWWATLISAREKRLAYGWRHVEVDAQNKELNRHISYADVEKDLWVFKGNFSGHWEKRQCTLAPGIYKTLRTLHGAERDSHVCHCCVHGGPKVPRRRGKASEGGWTTWRFGLRLDVLASAVYDLFPFRESSVPPSTIIPNYSCLIKKQNAHSERRLSGKGM